MKIFRMKKAMIISLILLLLISLPVFLYDYPKKISIEYPAIEYAEGKPENSIETSIKIDGILKQPILGNRTFSGRIIIDNYEYTEHYDLIDITFYNKVQDGMGTLSYS